MVTWNERDVEDYLYEHPESFKMFSSSKVTWVARQYSLPSGILDLLGRTEQELYFVVEIKNVPLTSAAVAQVCRYAADIENILLRSNVYNAQIHPVHKYLLFPRGCLSKVQENVIHEANALDVTMRTFDVDFGVSVTDGFVCLNEKREEEIQDKYSKCAEDKIFQINGRLPEMELESE